MAETAGSTTMAQARFDDVSVVIYRSESDGSLVVDIDTSEREGPLRVYVNDGAIWNGDPEVHLHDQCRCVHDFDSGDDLIWPDERV